MKLKWILIPIILGGLAIAGVVIFRNDGGKSADRIKVSGNIELTEVNVAFKMAGRLVERTVDEGDAVRKGMEIAKLDQEQLLKQRDAAVAAMQGAQALLAQSETALAWQKQTLVADMESRQGDLTSAEAKLLELKTGARPQEIQQAKAAVDAAQSEYDRSRKDWDRAQTLYKNDDISASQYDMARARWEAAEAQLKQANERSSLVLAGARSEDIEAAAGQVQRARAGIKAAQANELDIKRREQELAARRSDIDRAKAQIELIDSQLADTVAKSPVDGVVLVKSADVGEVLAPGTTVVTVGDIDHPWLRAYVNETDLGRVKLGAPCRVTTDAFPGKIYNGKISFISSEAEFTPKQIQTADERVKLVYRIKIDVENPNRELKSNMPADAEILVGK
jgi:HlyD family secretion protein